MPDTVGGRSFLHRRYRSGSACGSDVEEGLGATKRGLRCSIVVFSRASGSAAPLWPWLVAAVVVVAGGGWIVWTGMPASGLIVLLGTAGSVVVAARFRLLALGLLVGAVMLQIVVGAEVNPAQALAGTTFYLVGRWGSRRQHWSAIGVVLLLGVFETAAAVTLGSALVEGLLSGSRVPAGVAVLTAVVAAGAVLVVPLLVGVAEQARARGREDLATRERAEQELAEARVLARVEAERARLARDVHDTVGHALTVVITQTRVLAAVAKGDPGLVLQAAATVEQVAGAALEDVRGVLAGAVQMADVTAEDLVELARSTDRVHVLVTGVVPPLGGEVGEAAYRAVQELVTNALRHGDPDESIAVSISAPDGQVRIEVRNRIGSQTAEPRSRVSGSGLDGLRARLEEAGGELVTSDQEGSWVARASLPLAGRS